MHLFGISDQDLLSCNKQGFIPGPKETEEAFLARIEALKQFFESPPEGCEELLTDGEWAEAREITRQQFDFEPDWIVAYFSNEKLPFFQGGATWIDEREGKTIPLIQLKKRFSGTSMGTQILAHEAVHAARMSFKPGLFEEYFAYRTSKRFWRRFFGPLFHKTWEAVLFMLLFCLPLISQPLGYLPWGFAGLLLIRLCFFQAVLGWAAHKIKKLGVARSKEWAVLMRLTDREIFSLVFLRKKLPSEGIRGRLIKTYIEPHS